MYEIYQLKISISNYIHLQVLQIQEQLYYILHWIFSKFYFSLHCLFSFKTKSSAKFFTFLSVFVCLSLNDRLHDFYQQFIICMVFNKKPFWKKIRSLMACLSTASHRIFIKMFCC